LSHDYFNQLCSNEGKIVPTQVLPDIAKYTLPAWIHCATVAVGKPEQQVRKASHRGSKQQ